MVDWALKTNDLQRVTEGKDALPWLLLPLVEVFQKQHLRPLVAENVPQVVEDLCGAIPELLWQGGDLLSGLAFQIAHQKLNSDGWAHLVGLKDPPCLLHEVFHFATVSSKLGKAGLW